MIIAIEGIDASGKKTQAARLGAALKDPAYALASVEVFDFPHYQTIAGGIIGRILRGELVVAQGANDDSLDKAYVLQAMYLADRCEHSELLNAYASLDPTAAGHSMLVLDRYVMSGLVYGQVDGLDRNWLKDTHAVLPPAGLTFLLDISVEESVRRRPERADYYERNLPKLEKIRQKYLLEFSAHAWDTEDPGHYFVLDGTASEDEITAQILERVAGRL